MHLKLAMILICFVTIGGSPLALAGNFSAGDEPAVIYGVHEIELAGDGSVPNPLDTLVTVTFTPPSGAPAAVAVQAFYDGDNTWRARVYVSQPGPWRWESRCPADARLDGKSGTFTAADSNLRGRLLPHPKNSRQWITEDGRWFLNLNDTAYFLLCARNGNGEQVSDDDARQYVRDDVERGITSVRCFLGSKSEGYKDSPDQWREWYFADASHDRLRLDKLQHADRRLRMLLDEFPDVAVQLILFPLEAYNRDDRFWAGLAPAQRQRLLRQLVARFAAYPQLFWLITHDAHYGEKFPSNTAQAREVGAYLQQHDAWQHPRSTGHARKLPFYFGGEDWATYIHIEHAHDLGALQYEQYAAFAKPVFLGEDRYEQDHGPRLDPLHMRYWQRRLYWAWLLSGGSTNYGGRWWAVHPYTTTGTRATAFHSRPAVTFRAPLTGLDSVRFIRDYFEQRAIDLGDFKPAHALVADANANAADNASDRQAPGTPRLMRRGDDELLIYHPHAAAGEQAAQVDATQAARIRLDLRSVQGSFSVEWYRADDGQSQNGEEVMAGEWRELTAPWIGTDVVVRLVRKKT
jgi:hypothetical protein